MNSFITLLFLFLCPLFAVAQRISKELRSLVEAERKFSDLSAERGVAFAFAANFDPDVIYFNHEQKKVNYLEFAANQKSDGKGKLIWEPFFADIASSGDFGYTTGPFYFYQGAKDSIAGYGYYSSVWRRDKKGEWKVIMDLGISMPGAPQEEKALKTSSKPLIKTHPKRVEPTFDLMKLEREYSQKLNEFNHSFFKDFLSDEIRAHRPGRFPFIGKEAVCQISESDRTFSYQPMDIRMATSGDMGLAYGKVMIKVKKDTGIQEYSAVYFRMWRKEDGKWKLVFDIIGFT